MIVSHWLESIRDIVSTTPLGGLFRPGVPIRRRSSWQGFHSSRSSVRRVEQLEDRTLLTPQVTIWESGTASEDGPTSVQFSVFRLNPEDPAHEVSGDLTVFYSVGGTATTGDYVPLSGWVTIPDGYKSAPINLTPIQDSIGDEGTETVTLTLIEGSAYDVVSGSASATATILDATVPTVSISATDANASEVGSNTGTFTITLSQTPTTATTISYSVAGSASSGFDYTPLTGWVIIPAGNNTATITVVPVADTLSAEGNETVLVTLSDAIDYDVVAGAGTATVTIADAPIPTVSISATDANASEVGSNTGTFTITLSQTPTTATTISYSVAGSASSGFDYTPLTGWVIIPAGNNTATITVVPVADTLSAEGNETVLVTLSDAIDYDVVAGAGTATVTIADAPIPTVSIIASDPNASEVGPDNGSFTILLSAPATSNLTINYLVGGTASNPSDYNPLSGWVTIPAGQYYSIITITPVQDSMANEGAETVVLSIMDTSDYDVDSKNSSATVTITEALPTLSITASDPTASEVGPDSGSFTISLNSPLSSDLSFGVLASGTATSSDYGYLTLSWTIPAGQMSTTITVFPIHDSLVEGNETVVLTLFNSASFNIDSKNSSATVTITDAANGIPVVSIIASGPSASELGDTGAFTISLSGAVAADTTIQLAIGGSATSNLDYTALPTAVTIPSGQTSTTIIVTPILDTLMGEGTESVYVSLASSNAYQVDSKSGSATVNIYDVPLPYVSIHADDYQASENGPDSGTFLISLSNASIFDTTVALTIIGSAMNGVDYSTLPSAVTIPAGKTSTSISFTPVQDLYSSEGTEYVVVSIATSKEYSVDPQRSSAVASITDTITPVVSIIASDPNASEVGPDSGAFTISLTTAMTWDVTVDLFTYGSATSNTDYTELPSAVTIPAGKTSTTISFTPIQDFVGEGNETVSVGLSGSKWYNIDSKYSSATVAIADAPLPTVSIIASDPNASEVGPNSGAFTISLSSAQSSDVSIGYSIGGTASNKSDYDELWGSVTIPAGKTSATVIITPIQDAVGGEGAETVVLSLYSSKDYDVDSKNSSATVTIADASLPTVSITASDPNASEVGPESGAFTISLSAASSADTTVYYSIGGTASNKLDYNELSGSVTILAGQTSTSITTTPVQDAEGSEGSETVVLSLYSSTDYDVDSKSSSATVAIADAPLPTVSIIASDPNASEVGPNSGAFTISLSSAQSSDVSIGYSIGGTASNKSDYDELWGSVTIPAGKTSATVIITPIQDAVGGEGAETVVLSLYSSKDYDVDSKNSSATVTIADASLPTVSISASDASASEVGPDSGAFTISLSSAQTSDVSISYAIGGNASNKLDYDELSGSVTIPAGKTSTTITITPVQDSFGEEGFETVTLSLSGSKFYDVDSKNSGATVAIADAEPGVPTDGILINLTTDSNNDGGISSEDDSVEDDDPGMILTISDVDSGDHADVQPVLLTVTSDGPQEIESAHFAQVRFTGDGAQSFLMWMDGDRSTSIPTDGIITLSWMDDGTFGAVIWVEAIGAGQAVIEAELLDDNDLVFAQPKKDGARVKTRLKNIVADREARKAIKEDGEIVSYEDSGEKSIELLETYEVPYSRFVDIPNATMRNNAIRDDIISKIGFSNSPGYTEALIWDNGTFGPQANVINSGDDSPNGTSGWLMYLRYSDDSAQLVNDGTGRLDFTGLVVRVMPYLVVFSLQPSGRQFLVQGPPLGDGNSPPTYIIQGPANTLEHERWHTNGVPLAVISNINQGLEDAAGVQGNSPKLNVQTRKYFDLYYYKHGNNPPELVIKKEIPFSDNNPPTMFLLTKQGYYSAAADALDRLVTNLRNANGFAPNANPTAQERKQYLESLLSNWLAHDARKNVVQKSDEPAIFFNGAISIINWSGAWHTNVEVPGYNKPTFLWNNTLAGEAGSFATLAFAILKTDP